MNFVKNAETNAFAHEFHGGKLHKNADQPTIHPEPKPN